MSLTYFVAVLKCPRCGQISPADTSTGIQSQLLPDAGIFTLSAGDRPDIGIGDVEDSYLTLTTPRDTSSVRILETWNCPHCGSDNWALILFEDWRIRCIQDVNLTVEMLRSVHYVSRNIEEWYLDREGKVLFEGERPHVALLPLLEQSLARTEGDTTR